jgi:hypothetical protein
MPLYDFFYSKERHELIQALANTSLQSEKRRDDIVSELSPEIRDNIGHRSNVIDHVGNIVVTCCRYEDGLQHLFDLIRKREGMSIPYKCAFEFWQNWHWRVVLIDLMDRPYGLIAEEQLLELYAACRPPTAATSSHLPDQPTVQVLITTLWDTRDAYNRRVPIVQLVLLLAELKPTLRASLEKWLQDVCTNDAVDINEETIRQARQLPLQNNEANQALLVEVVPVDANDEQRISVTLYRWSEKQNTALQFAGPIPAPQQLHELPVYLFSVLSKAFRRSKPQTIELILPLSLIAHDWSYWWLTEEGEAVLKRSALLVRLRERQEDNGGWAGFLHDSWLSRWNSLQEQAGFPTEDHLRCLTATPPDLIALQEELQNSAETCAILFTFPPGQTLSLFERTLIRTGIPVALWPYQPNVDVLSVVTSSADKPLWQHVHALQQHRASDIGRCLALLWDDPQRVIPTFQSHAPF